jgi:hypothetical protein
MHARPAPRQRNYTLHVYILQTVVVFGFRCSLGVDDDGTDHGQELDIVPHLSKILYRHRTYIRNVAGGHRCCKTRDENDFSMLSSKSFPCMAWSSLE